MSLPSITGKSRPEFRNIHVTQILHYKLPPPGMVSILHRMSGAVLFLALPLILWLFDLSLMSELSFERLVEIGSHWLVKLVLLGLIWAFVHHLVAGLRYLCSTCTWEWISRRRVPVRWRSSGSACR